MNLMAPLNMRQTEYLHRCATSWFNVAEGGKRGGKNVLQTLAFCIALENHPNRLHLVAGVSTTTAKLNILDCDGYGLMNYFDGRCRAGEYQKRDCLYIETCTGRKVVLVSGGGKNGDEKLIKGNSYGMAYITEANECAPAFLKEVFDRTIASKDRKIFHDLNPKAEGHWYYTDILKHHEDKQLDNAEYGYNYGHFTIADNMSISDETLRTVIDTYDKKTVWYRRDILGMRAQAEGLVYDMFDPMKHGIKSEAIPTMGEHYISVDYGTLNPFAAGLWRVANGKAYLVREFYYDGRSKKKQLTDEEYYTEICKLAGDCFIRYIVVDPSAASFIACIRKHGKYSVRGAVNDVLDGIRYTARFLKNGRLLIAESCVNTIREFGLYRWDDEKTEDKPIKENDHAMDMVRYYAMTVLRREFKWLE